MNLHEISMKLVEHGAVGLMAYIFYKLYVKEKLGREKSDERYVRLLKDCLKMTDSFEDMSGAMTNLVKHKDPSIVEILNNTRELRKDYDVEKEVQQRLHSSPYIQVRGRDRGGEKP